MEVSQRVEIALGAGEMYVLLGGMALHMFRREDVFGVW